MGPQNDGLKEPHYKMTETPSVGSPGIDVSNNFSVHPRLSDDFYGPLDGVPRDIMAACFTRQILSFISQNSCWEKLSLNLGCCSI